MYDVRNATPDCAQSHVCSTPEMRSSSTRIFHYSFSSTGIFQNHGKYTIPTNGEMLNPEAKPNAPLQRCFAGHIKSNRIILIEDTNYIFWILRLIPPAMHHVLTAFCISDLSASFFEKRNVHASVAAAQAPSRRLHILLITYLPYTKKAKKNIICYFK